MNTVPQLVSERWPSASRRPVPKLTCIKNLQGAFYYCPMPRRPVLVLSVLCLKHSLAYTIPIGHGFEPKFLNIRKGDPVTKSTGHRLSTISTTSTQLAMSQLNIDATRKQPEYVQFQDVSEKQDILLKFAAELDIAAERNDGMRRFFTALKPTFAKLISPSSHIKRDVSEKLRASVGDQVKDALKYSAAHNRQLDTYMFTFNGWSDSMMIKYAKTYQFPRGCPVLWKPGHFIDIRGFYPKFENDKLTETGFDSRVLEGASSIEFFLKWSGFLIQLFSFEIEGCYYWSVLSKSKADLKNPFVQLGRKLIEPKITYDLAKELADNHLYLGAEGLSSEDDMHGYIARMNAAIVTCIGQGTYANLKSNKNIFFENRIVQYRKHNEITEFCRKFRLSCDNAISIRGDYHMLAAFTNLLFARRDFMKIRDFRRTFEMFERQYPAGCLVSSGTASHEAVAGDILEGMVFSITGIDGDQTTEKVKLPYYTWRTMFLRSWLGAGGLKKQGRESNRIADVNFITMESLSKMVAYTERWCTSPEGKAHFMKMMKAAAFTLQCSGQIAVNGKMCTMITENLHVYLADEIEQLSNEALEERAKSFDKMLTTCMPLDGFPVVCCFVLGPIGAGKTTFSERLERETGDMALHIDGDNVAGNYTEFLGSERSDASKAALYRCILQGKHPIFSTGGGVFDEFDVRRKLEGIFQREVKVVLCIMKDVKTSKSESAHPYEINEVTYDEMEQQFSELYGTDLEYMKRVVEGRVGRNEWSKTNEFAKINEKSQKNVKFAAQLAKQANHIFTIPYDTSPEYHENPQKVINDKVFGVEKISDLLKTPFSKGSEKVTGNFTQIRAVVSRKDPERGHICKHITMQYDSQRICTDFETYNVMKQNICSETRVFTADLYKLTGNCQNKKPVQIQVSVIRDCNQLQNAHVTELCTQFKPELMKQVTKYIQEFEEKTTNPIKFKLPSWDAKSKSTVDFEFELAKIIESKASNPRKADFQATFSKDLRIYNFIDILFL